MSSRISLGRSHIIATSAIREAQKSGMPAYSFTAVGSLRRCAPEIGNVAILAVTDRDQHAAALRAFATLPMVTGVAGQTDSSLTVATTRGNVTLHLTTPDQTGAALVWHTGPRAHTEQLRTRARRYGYRFGDGALLHDSGRLIEAASEEAVYAALSLPFIAPELREDDAVIAAAERNELPTLLVDMNIRGDLHMHSLWSDGRDTVETMVLACRQLGYEYIAITDHSQSSFASRCLSRDDVTRQRDEIVALREQVRGIHILHGVEVDIMRDGSLDFEDDILAGFDIVLASLHDGGGEPEAKLTARYLQAMRHPLVNVITHPANRTPAHSPGYNLDFDQLFTAAVETGTAMEIDGAPGHLDMDGAVAKRAAAAGVTIVVDSDCHRAEALGRQMRWGVATARRGGLEPHHVLNTRDVTTVRAFVDAKRARRK